MPYDKSDYDGSGRQSSRYSGAYDSELDLGYDGDSGVLTDPGSGRDSGRSGGRSSASRDSSRARERDPADEPWSPYADSDEPYRERPFRDDETYRDETYREDASHRTDRSRRDDAGYREDKSYREDELYRDGTAYSDQEAYPEDNGAAYREDRSSRKETSYREDGSRHEGRHEDWSLREGRTYREDPVYQDGETYRPEVDYDPDYQRPDYGDDEEYQLDHAMEFQRVGSPQQVATRPRPSRVATGRSRASRSSRSARPPKPLRRRRIGRWLVVACVAMVALVGVAAAVVWRYADGLLSGQQTQVAGTAVANAGEPINIVLAGSDSREDGAAESLGQTAEDVGGQRADTIMVLHVNPEQKRAVLVSIPRDLQTQVNGQTAKINAAGSGGPSLIVETVEQTTGLDVNHYVEINFSGFVEVVDTLGGVELCNDTGEPLVDRMAGLNMPPGCHNFSGERALGFVRARYIDSDFGRIARQQQFMRALMTKIGSAGNLINVPQLVTLANQLSDTIVTDQDFSASEAVRIARGMGSLSLDDVDMRTYPSIGAGPECEGCPAFVRPLPEAQLLMQAIAAEDEVLPPVGVTGSDEEVVTLADTPVRVINGGDVQGAAADTAEALDGLGMATSVEGNTPEPIGAASQISYGENMAAQAELLRALLPGAEFQLVPADPEAGPGPNSLTITIGSSWPGADIATGRPGVSGLTPDPVAPDADTPSVPDSEFGDPDAGNPDTGGSDTGTLDPADPADPGY